MTVGNFRKPDYPIASIFAERWSHRAFTAEEISDGQLFTFFEAARWAPSATNAQPWRFLYSKRFDPHWDTFSSLIFEGNREWSDKAAAIVFILSAKTRLRDGQVVPSVSHSFDTGAAWENFALQAHLDGWSARAIGGFDRQKALQVLKVPDDFAIETGLALGRPGPADLLPEKLREREVPNGRRPIAELVARGAFSWE